MFETSSFDSGGFLAFANGPPREGPVSGMPIELKLGSIWSDCVTRARDECGGVSVACWPSLLCGGAAAGNCCRTGLPWLCDALRVYR